MRVLRHRFDLHLLAGRAGRANGVAQVFLDIPALQPELAGD
jgi:hypothetical protein